MPIASSTPRAVHTRHMLVNQTSVIANQQPCGWAVEPTRFPPRRERDASGGVLAIVPGVADATRARMTVSNIDHLRPRSCITFTHKRCGEDPALDTWLDVGPQPELACPTRRCFPPACALLYD